jgi:DNA processing protein
VSGPTRNAVTAGLARAAVVVEAGHASGARLLARLAAQQGRPVLLLRSLLDREPWAREFAARWDAVPVHDVDDVLRALGSPGMGERGPRHPPGHASDGAGQLSL